MPHAVGTKVKYKGVGRPYLGNFSGEVVSTNSTQNSNLVDFKNDEAVTIYTEWVGARFLEPLPDDPIQQAVADLMAKLKEKKDQISKAQEQVEALRKDEDALQRAIDALRVL